TRSPNYGINAGTLSLGMNYLIGDCKNFSEPEIPEISKRFSQSVIYAAGGKVYDNLLAKKYFISSLTYNLDYRINYKRRIGAGADLFYDASIGEALADRDEEYIENKADLFRFGLHVSHSIQYKKIAMEIHVGHYLYSHYTDLFFVLQPNYF
ncbi:MAG: hypothetical protein HC906_04525, partial [Bacteroidales bacterium]|nr:hypothetical protein [Bacteroidales bacterium]